MAHRSGEAGRDLAPQLDIPILVIYIYIGDHRQLVGQLFVA
jgi:hypothetical protein